MQRINNKNINDRFLVVVNGLSHFLPLFAPSLGNYDLSEMTSLGSEPIQTGPDSKVIPFEDG